MKALQKIGVLMISVGLGACASSPPAEQNGPIVLNVRANPDTVVMDSQYEPKSPAEILAEVKDYKADVKEVRVNVKNTPIEAPMKHVAGTTWRATLDPDQLKTLAIGNQTTEYDLNVTAKDGMGLSKTETSIASIKVQGPELDKAY